MMKQILNKTTVFQLFTYIWITLTALGILDIIIMDGYPLKTLIWNAQQGGVFPDFFETIFHARELNPYDLKAVYPALVYVLFFPFSRMIGEGTLVWEQKADSYKWLQVTSSQGGIVLAFIFFSVVTVLLWMTLCSDSKLSSKQSVIFLLFFIISPGYIFMIERGNLVLLVAALIAAFIRGYQSENRTIREFSIISLAIAICFKIYPAIFVIILIKEKRIKDVFRIILYVCILFFGPFIITGGINSFWKMIHNIVELSSGYRTNSRDFGYGYLINIPSIVSAIKQYYTGTAINTNVSSLISLCILLFLITMTFVVKTKWQEIYILTIAMIWVPNFSYMYTAVYLIIPLAFYFKEMKDQLVIPSKETINTILFSIIFSIMPYKYLFVSLPGRNKISTSTIAVVLSMILLLLNIVYGNGREIYELQKRKRWKY